MLSLTVSKRDSKAKLETLRAKELIPAVFYGPKEVSTSISVKYGDFVKVWKKAGESSIIELKTEDGDHDALIHEVDVHPVTGVPRHVDFYIIEKGKKVEVDVPIIFQGVSPAVKDLGGILVKVLHSLPIKAGAKDLPHEVVVDISSLVAMDSNITAGSLNLGAGVELMVKPEDIIAAIAAPKEEAAEPAAPIDMAAIEVEKKGKEVKEGEGEAAAEPAKK